MSVVTSKPEPRSSQPNSAESTAADSLPLGKNRGGLKHVILTREKSWWWFSCDSDCAELRPRSVRQGRVGLVYVKERLR